MSEYQLKRPVIDRNRLKKHCTTMLKQSEQDRKEALEYVRYFRKLVDDSLGKIETPEGDIVVTDDNVSKKCITDCLRLAQTAKQGAIKILDMMVKLEELDNKGSGEDASPFSLLEGK